MSNRYKLLLSYNGKRFEGFQQQKSKRTVEKVLREALRSLFKNIENFKASGRTDSGVHAIGQVIQIDSPLNIPAKAVKIRLNALLPDDVQIESVESVDETFDARYSAIEREYHYLFSEEHPPLVLSPYVTQVKFNLPSDINSKAKQYAATLVGRKDFKYLRNLGSSEKTTVRTIAEFSLSVHTVEDLYYNSFTFYRITVIANSFLYRMVRHIVGVFFEFLRQKITLEEIETFIDTGSTSFKYTVAPAKGLALVSVKYGEKK